MYRFFFLLALVMTTGQLRQPSSYDGRGGVAACRGGVAGRRRGGVATRRGGVATRRDGVAACREPAARAAV